MEYSAAATVVALMRNLPKDIKLTELGDMLLEAESAEQLWDEIMGTTLILVPGSGPDRDAATHDIELWHARGAMINTCG